MTGAFGSCGCCGSAVTAVPVVNRPGLSELALRVSTHHTMFADLVARLSAADLPALAALTVHETSDPATALLDAWAVVGDVLTFYQERIGNEGYLRTATERRSLVELAALVGYRPRPGVSASTYVAYTIDDNSGPVELPAGSRINSVPGPGEVMQTFETSEPLQARREWNRLAVRQVKPQTALDVATDGLVLAGTATGLAVGDALLLDAGLGLGSTPCRVRAVSADPAADRTVVTLEAWSGQSLSAEFAVTTLRLLANTAAFDVDASGVTAKKVLGTLASLERRTRAGEDPSAAATDALAVVGEGLDAARRNGWTRLAGWLDEGVQRLGRLVPAGTVDATRPSRVALLHRRKGESAVAELLDDLAIPPSVPPRGSRQLVRTAEATLARGGDLYPSLLATLRPELAPALYGALAETDAAPASEVKAWALRVAAPLFGHNSPLEAQFDDGVFTGFTEWNLDSDEASRKAFLDRDHPDVLQGTPALVTRPESADFPSAVMTRIEAVAQVSRNSYGLGGKSTFVQFADDWWQPDREVAGGTPDDFAVLRAAIVHCGAEQLTLADAPIAAPVCGGELELDQLYDGLRSGRWLILEGERADLPGVAGVHAAELVMLAGVTQTVQTLPADPKTGLGSPLPGEVLHSFVTLATPLAYCYRRDTVVLHGNVAHATHGETRQEVLGGGDPTRPGQAFRLRQPPLTWTSAPTTSGVASSLDVRVDEVSWHEAGSLVELGATSRGFLTRQDDAGATTVIFGDGVHGARLPTGTDNVRAIYRQGLGKAGNVAAGQLSQLGSRPLGVKDVVNPIRATGGADAESRDQIRRNAPLAILALDRLVSTQDHADFARTFAGVAKAAAVRLSDGRRELVQVTIAGVDDAPLDQTSDLYRNLSDALHRFGDPALPLRLQVRRLLALVISAGVKVLPDHHWDVVEPMVRAAVLDSFGFDRRELGQDVLPSELVACIQAVRGVDYVDLDLLEAISTDEVSRRLAAGIEPDSSGAVGWVPIRLRRPALPARVMVSPARLLDGQVLPAELAYLQPGVPDALILNELTGEEAR